MTPATLSLFKFLANDAANWSGQPLLQITKEQRGNLTQLKKEGLLTTHHDEGCDWVTFTEKGDNFAASLGIDTRNVY